MAFNENITLADFITIEKVTKPMKTRQIIAVGGTPGTGKTTLFRKFMEGKTWLSVEPAKLVSAMYNEELDLYILGKYQEGETFAGTDRLGMSCQPSVEQWIATHNSNILFEGDRLTNSKFYNFLITLPASEVNFIILHAKKDTLIQRYADRGSNQSETFLKGRDTKIANLLTNFEFMSYITEFTNESLADQGVIIKRIEQMLHTTG